MASENKNPEIPAELPKTGISAEIKTRITPEAKSILIGIIIVTVVLFVFVVLVVGFEDEISIYIQNNILRSLLIAFIILLTIAYFIACFYTFYHIKDRPRLKALAIVLAVAAVLFSLLAVFFLIFKSQLVNAITNTGYKIFIIVSIIISVLLYAPIYMYILLTTEEKVKKE